ncbi:hypothetical protein TCE0_011r00460 [Talaromyces pinophilus]|uniref:Uncharacterized protein n=1 Tax=Talaromyces pinophilus TaxID=128442 RepID=A0A0B8MXX4_TALPI|nr:Hypothetical protein PENO1_084450 [Penicillium occitanis (nom. inval.)]PCH00997.1 hypothetical protein PENOC_050250 [Penicillium occitanis (nom. inval.)]GAM33513.1 hypothetical protein TCE0_011r00460 [Talaromyces pinophilus]
MAPSIETMSPAPVHTPLFENGTKHIPENPLPASQTKLPNGKVYVEELLTKSDKNFDAHEVPFNPQYAMNPRKLKIITIGAGFSGLLIAHKFQHRFPELQDFVEHTIFEARSDIGGTWLVNTYPGVQCDVPAHIYAFPFDPNPDWPRFYSSGASIQDYIKRTTKKWNLDRDVQLNTKVVSAYWQEEEGKWKVTVEHEGKQRVEFCDILISGQGNLVQPSWPKVPGLSDFKGHITHSARWDHDFDYSNKRIAVIGNGSSGIQIVPQMTKLPGTTVRNFIRGPAWVYYRVPASKHLGRDTVDTNPEYFDEEKAKFSDPVEHRDYRKGIIHRTNKAFRLFIKGEFNQETVRAATAQMAEKLNHDPDLCEKLIPKWEIGCRRVTPGPGYLESFSKPNCSLTNSPITQITENGVVTADGQEYECDVLICATGFDVSKCPQYPLVGQNGVNLAEKWKYEPNSYLSVGTNNFPNYFLMAGPNCLCGHGSLVESLNWTGDYFVKMIKKIATEDIKYMVPKEASVDAFGKYQAEIHKTLVWTGSCSSWYKRGTVDGKVTHLFAGSAVLFRKMLMEIRSEHYDIVYNSGNPFRFMGNGFTEWEMREDADLAWYVQVADREPKEYKGNDKGWIVK